MENVYFFPSASALICVEEFYFRCQRTPERVFSVGENVTFFGFTEDCPFRSGAFFEFHFCFKNSKNLTGKRGGTQAGRWDGFHLLRSEPYFFKKSRKIIFYTRD
jgi:hypothetical protein